MRINWNKNKKSKFNSYEYNKEKIINDVKKIKIKDYICKI